MTPLNEDMKAKYDVIAEKQNGKVVVIHNKNNSPVLETYNTVHDFMTQTHSQGLKAVVLESING